MNKAKSLLTPEVAQLIRSSYPIVKNRTALWFFKQELLGEKQNGLTNSAGGIERKPESRSAKTYPKVKRSEILDRWNHMNPEAKRKYFNLAEFDEVRYKEQKYMWIAQMGSLLVKYREDLESLKKYIDELNSLQKDFLVSLEWSRQNYEHLIQAESTKELYKDVMKRADKVGDLQDTVNLISSVPEDYRSILTKPRRPPVPFVIYACDNMDRLRKLRDSTKLKGSLMKLAGEEWFKTSKDEKMHYEERYQNLMDEYHKANEIYKSTLPVESSLDRAFREKKAFKRSLRKRLRDSSVLPINVRNAFNFFLMDRKEVRLTELTEVWRNLPEEKKLKYKRMNEEDARRYQKEKEVYEALMADMISLIESNKNKTNDKGS